MPAEPPLNVIVNVSPATEYVAAPDPNESGTEPVLRYPPIVNVSPEVV